MIDGLKVTLSGFEVVNQLDSIVRHHRDRATLYAEQLEKLGIDPEDDRQMSNSPRRTLQSKVEEHANKAEYYHFLAEKLNINETYRLSQYELQEIGFIKK